MARLSLFTLSHPPDGFHPHSFINWMDLDRHRTAICLFTAALEEGEVE